MDNGQLKNSISLRGRLSVLNGRLGTLAEIIEVLIKNGIDNDNVSAWLKDQVKQITEEIELIEGHLLAIDAQLKKG